MRRSCGNGIGMSPSRRQGVGRQLAADQEPCFMATAGRSGGRGLGAGSQRGGTGLCEYFKGLETGHMNVCGCGRAGGDLLTAFWRDPQKASKGAQLPWVLRIIAGYTQAHEQGHGVRNHGVTDLQSNTSRCATTDSSRLPVPASTPPSAATPPLAAPTRLPLPRLPVRDTVPTSVR